MKGFAYYNEFDPFAAAWLRELIKAGHIAEGVVDERSITEVQPDDLRGFDQCHFFAGIGGWSLALRFAGWPDDRPVWTGSCPCQPFSSAGKQKGGADSRHLWPHWARLIRECRPATVFGEQVAAAVAHGWLDAVFDDLEGDGYACGAVSLPACSVGAFHRRDRVWFVAESCGAERRSGRSGCDRADCWRSHCQPTGSGNDGELADAEHAERGPFDGPREDGRHGAHARGAEAHGEPGTCGEVHGVGHASESGLQGLTRHGDHGHEPGRLDARPDGPTATASAWRDVVWLPCRDGKARPTQSGLQPLATRLPGGLVPSGDPSESYANDSTEARVGRLRGYGNSIVPQVAAMVIGAYMEGL